MSFECYYEYYYVTPRIVKVGVTTRITIKPRYEQRSVSALLEQGAVWAETISNSGHLKNGTYPKWAEYDMLKLHLDEENNEMWVEITPAEEGELTIRIMNDRDTWKDEVLKFDVFACNEDLFALRPYRGDMHVHTSYSECGCREENPRFAAAWGCYAGLDYIVITDHAQREPSVIAQEAIDAFGSDYKVFNGEEVHLLYAKQDTLVCKNRFIPAVHIVNFGGREGVVKYMNEHFDEYMADLKARASKLPGNLDESVRMIMAGSDWVIDKIHEFGGMAIFAHPFWRPCNRLNLSNTVRDYIMQQDKFDCMEVIGLGDNITLVESNLYCVAWWQQESIKRGKMIPLVGDTDSHATLRCLNKLATIVFAKDNSFESITDAIKQGRSVAGMFEETPKLFGDLRYVQYAYFLLRNFYPEHDDMCKTVGKLMLDCLNGESTTAEIAPLVKNRLNNLFAKYWAVYN